MAASFTWGDQTWSFGDLAAFQKYLAKHNVNYSTWATNHPDAAAILQMSPQDYYQQQGYNEQPVSRGAAPNPNPPPTVTDTVAPPDTSDPGGNSPTTPALPPPDTTDYSVILGFYGLSTADINEINRIYHSSLNPDGSINMQEAYTLAVAYVRGTAWYATTYPGIQAGINAGLFNDESGYKAYQNQVNQIVQQYYQRPATAGEVANYIAQGQTVARVAAGFQSAAILGNISDPLKGLFTPDQLKAFADQQAGIDTALGQQVTKEANLATQVNLLYQNFYGRGVTKSELDTLTANGTDAQAVAQQFATQDNINGMNPAIKDLFTPAEIQQIALEAAGGTTQNGQQLTALANLATQLNPIAHQYTGAGISRDEINSAYTTGLTPTQYSGQLQGKAYADANAPEIQQTTGSFGEGLLSSEDLQSLGQEATGYDTPQGQKVLAAFQRAQTRMAGAFKGSLASPAVTHLLRQQTPDVGA